MFIMNCEQPTYSMNTFPVTCKFKDRPGNYSEEDYQETTIKLGDESCEKVPE